MTSLFSLCMPMSLSSVTQSCPTLAISWTISCKAPLFMGSKILEWIAISSSRVPSQLRHQTSVSHVFCTAWKFFSTEPPVKPFSSFTCNFTTIQRSPLVFQNTRDLRYNPITQSHICPTGQIYNCPGIQNKNKY